MDFDSISWIGVALGTFALFVLGALWYGPFFGKPWRKLVGVPDDAAKQAPEPKLLLGALVVSFLMVAGLASVIGDDQSWSEGALNGLGIAVFISAATLALQYLFEQRSSKLLAINAGYYVVGFLIAGALIAAFQ